ncbi:MAG: DnaJ domain-containing protein [Verrucomicrobia bacterium]|nr:DnaJ domain-containing protein [Verrucomicrobiota bacterium]
MTDYFALLNEPRRPWLEAEELKQRFRQLSTAVHPDRFHTAPDADRAAAGQRYADLNTAYQCLLEPRERLRHLLELELGAKPKDVQRIPPGTMDLFVEVGQSCRDADAFLAERAKVTSPMLKVQMFQRGMEWTDKLNGIQRNVNAMRDGLSRELQELNAAWDAAPAIGSANRAPALPLERLEQIYRVLSYVTRWTEQLQERVVQLAM